MTTYHPSLFDKPAEPAPVALVPEKIELLGWSRAKALGDIGRNLECAFNDGGQVTIIVYAWQRDLLVTELLKIEETEAQRFTDHVLADG